MKKAAMVAGKALLFLLALNLLYLTIITLVNLPPNAWIENNVQKSMLFLEGEGDYPQLGGFGSAAQLDNWTDGLFLKNALKENTANSFVSAVSVHTLHKFWHGYLVVIRPLLLFFSYIQLRFLNMAVLTVLLFSVGWMLIKRFSVGAGLAFGISLLPCFINVVCFSLALSVDFILMSVSALIALTFGSRWNEKQFGIFFLTTGSVYNFLNFLMAPLVALIIPLCIAFLFYLRQQNSSYKRSILFLITQALCWVFGYAFTWVFKWVVSVMVLGPKALIYIFSSVEERLRSTDVSRSAVMSLNFTTFFSRNTWLLLAIVLIVWAALMLRGRNSFKTLQPILPVALLCFIPYVWYLILSNHSYNHFWYTFRAQVGSLFIVLLLLFTMPTSRHASLDKR